jgi:hypothetical protein
MPVNPNKSAMEPRNYTQYFNILAFAVVTLISMGLLISPFIKIVIYPLAVYYYVKSNININWWQQRVVRMLFSVVLINSVMIMFTSSDKGLLSPYFVGIIYFSWLALALANFYFIKKWKTKFIETIDFAISKKEFISWLSAAIIIACFIFSALGSVLNIHYLYREITLHSKYNNYHHDGVRGKIYDGVGVTARRLSGYGETNERVDVVTICNKSSHPIKASESNYDLGVKMHSIDSKMFSGELSSTGLSGEKLNPGMCVHSTVVFQTPATTIQGYLAVQVNGYTYNLFIDK